VLLIALQRITGEDVSGAVNMPLIDSFSDVPDSNRTSPVAPRSCVLPVGAVWQPSMADMSTAEKTAR
jgi:hypothetical protein